MERKIVQDTIKLAEQRIENHPELLPFKSEQGRLVMSWFRGFVESK
jgi:hypothetical protein